MKMKQILKEWNNFLQESNGDYSEDELNSILRKIYDWIYNQEDSLTEHDINIIRKEVEKNLEEKKIFSFQDSLIENGESNKLYRGIAGISREELEKFLNKKITKNNFNVKVDFMYNSFFKNRRYDSWSKKRSQANKFARRAFSYEKGQEVSKKMLFQALDYYNVEEKELIKKVKEFDLIERDYFEFNDPERYYQEVKDYFGEIFPDSETASKFLISVRGKSQELTRKYNSEVLEKNLEISPLFDVIFEAVVSKDSDSLTVDIVKTAELGGLPPALKVQQEVIVFDKIKVEKVFIKHTVMGNRTMGVGGA